MPVNPVPLDGVSAPTDETPQASPRPQVTPAVRRWKGVLLLTLIALYVLYGGWSVVLMGILPSNDPSLRALPMLGLLVALCGGLLFVGIGAIMVQRISLSQADSRARIVALAKVVGAVLPGLLLSVAVPLITMRELPITLTIVSPASQQDMVAPVSMTFSVADALPGLAATGFVPVEFRWDVNNDRKTDQETSVPELIAMFEKEGSYTVAVVMYAADGSQKSAKRNFVIRDSVFKVTPAQPIVNQLAIFSLSHLYPPEGVVKEVQWDFNGDDVIDEKTASLEVPYTFFETGTETVRVKIFFQNNTETSLQRAVTIVDAPPLPFPVTLKTEPKNLIGSPPFPVLFSVTSDIVPAKVEWDFGDKAVAEGMKVAHTFEEKGSFPVSVRVFSQSGVVANLQTTVRMVDILRLNDLTFEGSHDLKGGSRIEDEVPVTLNLTPKTSTPFIVFQWEAPDATDVGSTDTTLQAIYRREGTYNVTLIGQDLEDHVLRMPITIVVKPATESLVIAMDPETGVAPLPVKFDASESFIPGETITGFIWNYGDGTDEQFGGARAEHTYDKEGTYKIVLKVRTTTGKEYSAQNQIVVREPLLRACITSSRLKGTIPMGVAFTSDCTVGIPDSYVWDFGDGAQSDQKNVNHVFEKAGTYVVKLTVKDGDASNTASVSITASEP